MDLRELGSHINQKEHWYYRSKSIPLINFAKKIIDQTPSPLTIVDIGAGSGYFSEMLDKKFGKHISKIIWVDVNYSEEEVLSSAGKRIEKNKKIPEEINNSIIIMMDVLEHLKEDNGFLNELTSKAKDENYFFITVPAFMSLWSYHDTYLLHYRRYTLKTLSNLINNSGIRIDSRYYLYFTLFPFAWLVRKILNRNKKEGNDMKQPSMFVNFILRSFFSLEMYFAKANKLMGTSCCVEGFLKK